MWNYYGSKSIIVDHYPPPRHQKIVECFAGSARYALKYWDREVLLVDKYEVIIKIWKYLQQCSAGDILGLPKQTTVLEYDRPTRSEDHPTMKPVKLYAYLLGNSCKKGGVALDTFAGSGTLLIASEQMGIQSRMVELDPRFCDVIIRRAYNYYKTNNLKFVIKRNGKLLKEDELSKF